MNMSMVFGLMEEMIEDATQTLSKSRKAPTPDSAARHIWGDPLRSKVV